MQLNGTIFKGIRGIRAFWVSLLAIIFGAVFIGFGIFFYFSDQGKTFETATAIITEQTSDEPINEDDQRLYHITLTYTDKEGVEHTGITMDTYDSSWVVGKEIEIKYNVADPEEVRITTPAIVLPILFVSLGSISIIAGVFGFVGAVKRLKRKPSDENQSFANSANDLTEDIVKDTKLFFHLTGKLNQSYAVEDKQGNVLFECKLLKFNPIASNLYEFVDHQTGDKKQMKIGKTITSESSGGFAFVGDVLSSHFKIDGVNCWDYLASRGYKVNHMLEGKTIINYQIVKNDKIVAKIFPADNTDPFNENSLKFMFMNKGYYRLEIEEANLPDVVMIAFIVGRTNIVE